MDQTSISFFILTWFLIIHIIIQLDPKKKELNCLLPSNLEMILQASLDRLPPFPFRTRPFLEEEMRDRDNDRRSTNESCRIFSLQQRDLLRNCMPLHDRGRFSGTIRVKRHRQANVGFTTSINRRACPPFIFHPFERTRSSKRAKTMAEARLRAAAPVYRPRDSIGRS